MKTERNNFVEIFFFSPADEKHWQPIRIKLQRAWAFKRQCTLVINTMCNNEQNVVVCWCSGLYSYHDIYIFFFAHLNAWVLIINISLPPPHTHTHTLRNPNAFCDWFFFFFVQKSIFCRQYNEVGYLLSHFASEACLWWCLKILLL